VSIFHFDPVINVWVLLSAGLLMAALVAWSVLRMRGLLPGRDLGWLGGLRGCGLALLLLALLQPFYIRRLPDRTSFEVAVVVDNSGSMDTVDTDGDDSRMSAAVDLVSDWVPAAHERGDVRLHTASTSLKSWPYSAEPKAGGSTALGDALGDLLEGRSDEGNALGAVVLLSDGQVNSGMSLLDVARRYRDAHIPLSVVGVGEHVEPGDLSVRFTGVPGEAPRGEALPLQAQVRNQFSRDKTVEVELWQGRELVDRRSVEVSAGGEALLDFEDIPEMPGMRTYRLKLLAPPEDRFPASDLDFVAVDVKNPERFRMLYVGSKLHWERRFISMVLKEDGRFQLDSVVRTGEDNFLVETDETGLEASDDPLDAAWWDTPYDAYILDVRSLAWLPTEAVEALAESVSRRGCGLLAVGPVNQDLPDEILQLLPVKDTKEEQFKDNRYLELEVTPVFEGSAGGSLFQKPGVYIPGQSPAWFAKQTSGGFRSMARMKGQDAEFFGVHAYGAGRVGYLGTENTWRWRMQSDQGMEQHRLFWTQMAFWLSSGGKPRLSMPLQGSMQHLGEPVSLDLRVRSQDFGPERNARVDAEILDPDGRSEAVLLNPATDDPGLYSARLNPVNSGEYEVRYEVTYADGERWEESAFFAVSPSGPEYQDTRFQEAVLRDAARVAGGEYRHYSEGLWGDDLPMAKSLPVVEERVYWTRNAVFFVLLGLAFLAEWYRRRLLGLR